MSKDILIFQQTYSEDSLCDLEEDIIESLDRRYNPIMKDIDLKKYSIKVTITAQEWEAEECN